MRRDPLTRAPGARRAQRILRQVARRPMTTVEIERALRPERLTDQDPADHGLKIRATIRRLAVDGRLIPGPAGWSPARDDTGNQRTA